MQRIQSVDVFRGIAIVMIIALHTQPFRLDSPAENTLYQYLDTIITNAARFAVPFFFAVSGYFWGIKIKEGNPPILFTLKKIRRIIYIFLFWCLVYLFPFGSVRLGMDFSDILHLLTDNVNALLFDQSLTILFMQGTKLHLWYLVALICSMAISAVFIHKNWDTGLFVTAVALYVFGVLINAYEFTPIGISSQINSLYGPFFGTLFFVSGYYLTNFNITSKWLFYGGAIFVLGCILHGSEIYYLWRATGERPWQDYVFGTWFMGIGFTVMALSNHPALQWKWMAQVGSRSLGIYVSHYIFVDLLAEFNLVHDSAVWEVGYVFVVFALSLGLVYLLSKNRFTKEFVL